MAYKLSFRSAPKTDEENPSDLVLRDATYASQDFETQNNLSSLNNSNDPVVQAATQLAQVLSGRSFDPTSSTVRVLSARAATFLDGKSKSLFDGLSIAFHTKAPPAVRILRFFVEISVLIKSNASVSIDALAERLVETGVVRAGGKEGEINCYWDVRTMVFVALGWITTLFEASYEHGSLPFTVRIRGATCDSFQISTVDTSLSKRSIAELLFSFGDILPFPRMDCYQNDRLESETGVFHVASLNAATLRKVGNIKFEWTETVGCHLEFNPAQLTVKLYRFPSLCLLYMTEDTLLMPLLRDYYADTFRSRRYTIPKLANEILLSYSLLFQCDANARYDYVSIQRKAASADSVLDPYLDELCMGTRKNLGIKFITSNRQPPRETFDALADFPVFSARLHKIQRFVDSIQPNQVRSLWRDKRDILRWYTFWAVVILGGFNLIISIAQTALSSAQVEIAQKALNAQLHTI